MEIYKLTIIYRNTNLGNINDAIHHQKHRINITIIINWVFYLRDELYLALKIRFISARQKELFDNYSKYQACSFALS